MLAAEFSQLQPTRSAQAGFSFAVAHELAEQHGTPLLVMSRSKLIQSYWAMRNALPGVDLYYAAKANPDPNILQTLCAENAFVDICSAGELNSALDAGFTVDRMLHTHPCKTTENLLACYHAGVRLFVYDNASEAAKIARLTPDVDLLLRLAVSGSSSVMNLSAKFGAPLEDALEMLRVASSLRLNVRGFSFHVGSQCLSAHDYCTALQQVRHVWEAATEMGFSLEILDIGGGFPAPNRHDAPSMESFGEIVTGGLREYFGDLPIRIIAEPGRGLCAESTNLITRVIGKSVRWGMPWFFLDDGIYGSFSGKVFDHANFPLWTLNSAERPLFECVVAGPTCDSGDVISTDHLLPDLDEGELVIVPCMGAYSGASSCPFNGLPVARSIAID